MTTSRALPRAAVMRRARVAVSASFLVNGALVATAAPRFPEIRDALGLSNSALGFAVAFAPVGGIMAGAVGGALVARVGSARLIVAAVVGMAAALALVGAAPSWPALALAFLAFGMADASMDIGQNAHGVQVQGGYDRSIMQSLHAFWAVGALTGGGASAMAAALSIPVPVHLAGAGVVLTLLLFVASRSLLPAVVPEVHHAGGHVGGRAGGQVRRHVRALGYAVTAVGGVAVMAFFAGVGEDAGLTWNAVYLRDALGAPAATAGFGYVAFAAATVLSRFAGDRLVDRAGVVGLVRGAGLGAAAGLGIVILAPAVGGPAVGGPPGAGYAMALAGYVLMGLSIGPVFPAMFAAAGARPGIPHGAGVAIVATLSRLGFFVAPALVGSIADRTGLQAALLIPLGATLAVAVLAGSLAPVAARRRPSH